MNLSVEAIDEFRAREGGAANDRPEYVSKALSLDKELGYHHGLPLIDPPGGEQTVSLGEQADYSHYPENILVPTSGDFLEELAEHPLVGNADDMSKELDENVTTVEKALDLFDINVTPQTTATEDKGLRLPSGETIPYSYLPENHPWSDPRVLHQLVQDGLSIEEIARYLNEQSDDNRITSDAVRQACIDARLLTSPDNSETGHTPYSAQDFPNETNTVRQGSVEPVDFS